MSTRSVIVRLEAEVSRYTAGMGQAATATDNVAQRVANTRRSVADNEAAMNHMGGVYTKVGAVTVAALGATAKAAMDWESAWTGVLKTVDGTPEQLSAVENGLRGLAKELPSSHTEIAAVAEAAGQLGIETGNVVAFTKTMIDMGQSTNLSAEDAATSLARFSNVMGTNQNDVGRLGATLVGLGNNFATTESEIMAMSMRLAGAGKQIGISEGQTMGLAAAMSSVGIEAEAGGSAMSTTMKRIGKAVDESGEDLETFAQVSGMSSAQFSKAWKDDAAGALTAFVLGLDKAGQSGESVNAILDGLGIKGIREADSLLRLSAAGELMGDAMKKGSVEYDRGTALIEEANKRYNTTASKVSVAWNNIKDAAIDAGAVLLPIIAGMAESVSGLSSMFGDMNPVVQGTITVFAGVVGVAALAGGGLLLLTPRIAATRAAMVAMNSSGSRIPGTLGRIGKAAGIASVAMIAVALAAQGLGDEQVTATGDYANAIMKVATAGQQAKSTDLDSVFGSWNRMAGISTVSGVEGLSDAVRELTNPTTMGNVRKFQDPFGKLIGMQSKLGQIEDRFKGLGESMGSLVSGGNTEAAAKNFQLLTKEFEKNGKGAQEALDVLPAYKEALLQSAAASGVNLEGQQLLNYALGQTPPALAAATVGQEFLTKAIEETGVGLSPVIEDMEKFLELLFQTGMLVMSSRDAQFAYEQSLRGVSEQVKTIVDSNGKMGAILNENASDFNMLSDAGKLANDTFQGVARDGMAQVEAMSKEGVGLPELQAKLTGTYEDLLVVAEQFGFVGVEAEDLARKVLGVPDGVEITTWMDDRAKKMAEGTKEAMDAIDGKVVDTYVNTHYTSMFDERHANAPGGSGGLQRAAGGPIYGPGTGTSDDVPVMASNGEHMFTAKEVQLMGGHDSVYRFRAGLHSGAVPAYAGGGAIGAVMTPSRQLAPASASTIDYDRLAAAVGPGVNMSGAKFTALDPSALERKITAAIELKLNSGSGVRLV